MKGVSGGGDFKGGMECCTEGYEGNFDRGVVKVENELGKIRRRERYLGKE